jgi:hypothetical protein
VNSRAIAGGSDACRCFLLGDGLSEARPRSTNCAKHSRICERSTASIAGTWPRTKVLTSSGVTSRGALPDLSSSRSSVYSARCCTRPRSGCTKPKPSSVRKPCLRAGTPAARTIRSAAFSVSGAPLCRVRVARALRLMSARRRRSASPPARSLSSRSIAAASLIFCASSSAARYHARTSLKRKRRCFDARRTHGRPSVVHQRRIVVTSTPRARARSLVRSIRSPAMLGSVRFFIAPRCDGEFAASTA